MQDFNNTEKCGTGSRIFWRNVLPFLAVLILLLAVLNAGCAHLAMRYDYMVPIKLKHFIDVQKEEENSLDLLILGNSLSYTSVSTMQLWENRGIAAYNCGHSGQKIQEAYETLRTVCKKQNPSVLLLETRLLLEEEDGIGEVSDRLDTWLDYHVPLYHLHDLWKSVLAGKNNTEEHFKGYTSRRRVQPYTGGEYITGKNEEQTKTSLPKISRSYLKKIISVCEDRGIRLVLFSTASPLNYSTQQCAAIEDFCSENELEYINFNRPEMREQIGIDWECDSLDFGDHLNESGAGKVTAYFEEYLEDTQLPDHRGEPEYEVWEEEHDRYMKIADRFSDVQT